MSALPELEMARPKSTFYPELPTLAQSFPLVPDMGWGDIRPACTAPKLDHLEAIASE